MDFEAVEAEITEIWWHLSAATFRFLELVAAFDQAEGWARHGVANCAQWLNLTCGIGPVAAREKVRVARSLEGLPRVSAAFREGTLSYSKVRAITRVATPETEGTLLNVALHGTATHVERLVRHYRRVRRIEDAARATAHHRNRFLHFRYDEDGSVSVYGRLPAEVGALVEKAITAAVDSMDTVDSVSSMDSMVSRNETFSATHDVAEAPTDADGCAVSSHRSHDPMTDAGDPREDERDPIGARRADALRLIAEQFLAGESKRCPSSTERYQVVIHIDQAMLTGDGERQSGGPGRCEIENRCTLAAETARRLACDSTRVGILEDADGDPLNVGRKTRAIPPALQRALNARDGGCRFPGCDRTHFTEGHHIVHWADGGETKLKNLITLCTYHHRLIHEGGFGLRVADDGAFVFTRPDGTRIMPGQALRIRDFDGRYRDSDGGWQEDESEFMQQHRVSMRSTGEKCFRGNILERLHALNASRGVDAQSPPGWAGERMDYGVAIERMLWEQRCGIRS